MIFAIFVLYKPCVHDENKCLNLNTAHFDFIQQFFFSDALAQSLHSPSFSSILADKLGQASNFSTSEFIHRGRFNLSQNGRIFANGIICIDGSRSVDRINCNLVIPVNSQRQSIVRILNLYIMLSCTHL